MQAKTELLNSYNRLKNLWVKYKHTYANDEEWIIAEQAFTDLFGMNKTDSEGYEHLKPDENSLEEELSKISPENYKPYVSFDGIDLEKMLVFINNRLETLLTKDHTIGHAWLMDVYSLADLQNAFKNKILPLLQEYFYNNYAKIGLVLGDNFFEEQKKVGKNIFASFKNGTDIAEDYNEKIIYKLKDATTLTLEDFKSVYE
jgi:5-methylcytosine-specific restriction protein B